MLYIMSTKPIQHTHCPIQGTLLLQYSTDNNLYVQYTLTSSQILGSILNYIIRDGLKMQLFIKFAYMRNLILICFIL